MLIRGCLQPRDRSKSWQQLSQEQQSAINGDVLKGDYGAKDINGSAITVNTLFSSLTPDERAAVYTSTESEAYLHPDIFCANMGGVSAVYKISDKDYWDSLSLADRQALLPDDKNITAQTSYASLTSTEQTAVGNALIEADWNSLDLAARQAVLAAGGIIDSNITAQTSYASLTTAEQTVFSSAETKLTEYAKWLADYDGTATSDNPSGFDLNNPLFQAPAQRVAAVLTFMANSPTFDIKKILAQADVYSLYSSDQSVKTLLEDYSAGSGTSLAKAIIYSVPNEISNYKPGDIKAVAQIWGNLKTATFTTSGGKRSDIFPSGLDQRKYAGIGGVCFLGVQCYRYI